jgi:hypothetical protein
MFNLKTGLAGFLASESELERRLELPPGSAQCSLLAVVNNEDCTAFSNQEP